ncbi:CapA family protein [Candidatus Peregrinibacteria bacterium]|nr:MAG: CapA family protein [Candidatus Peregrinibacteria bacterium]
MGDTHFGESYAVDLDDRYAMDQFSDLFETSDLTIANLETPLTSLEESPYEGEKSYVHWSEPEAASEAFRDYGFDVFSLGNNHSMDFAWPGLEETLTVLKQDFQVFGAGANQAEAAQPFETELLNLTVFGGYEDVLSHERIGFYASENTPGVYSITQEASLEAVRSFRAEHPEAFIVVFPHWGENYAMKDSKQETWAHLFIDAGADLILGHGAHLLQEVEIYEGKWIVYGLGNFIFKAPGRYQKLDAAPYSAVARLIQTEDGLSLRLYPILCDNLVTDYRTRFIKEEEFEELSEREDLAELSDGEDHLGFYYELPIH